MSERIWIRWAFNASDHSKVGTVEAVPADEVAWLVYCGNAVIVDAPVVPVTVEEALVAGAPAMLAAEAVTSTQLDGETIDVGPVTVGEPAEDVKPEVPRAKRS